jgi:hypothetical protein
MTFQCMLYNKYVNFTCIYLGVGAVFVSVQLKLDCYIPGIGALF